MTEEGKRSSPTGCPSFSFPEKVMGLVDEGTTRVSERDMFFKQELYSRVEVVRCGKKKERRVNDV